MLDAAGGPPGSKEISRAKETSAQSPLAGVSALVSQGIRSGASCSLQTGGSALTTDNARSHCSWKGFGENSRNLVSRGRDSVEGSVAIDTTRRNNCMWRRLVSSGNSRTHWQPKRLSDAIFRYRRGQRSKERGVKNYLLTTERLPPMCR